ncbi:MAG: TetR/AcrR family transcriptional regulator [Lentisphaeria bacterium]|nr:TetR/AcrR family transcriptional regulator [Lentisphaeria bacterium]
MTKENKRILILKALEELLPGRRFHEITLEEVAKAAQVGKGTIYLYFKDKDALFAELVCYQLERLSQELAALADCAIHDLPGRVFELVSNFIRRHRAGFGTVSGAVNYTANLSAEQLEKLRQCSSDAVDTLAKVFQKAAPDWSSSRTALNARALLWLVDGFMRSEFAREKSCVEIEEVLSFYKRGAEI